MSDPLLSHGGSWGFAMLNPNLTPVTITFEAFDEPGAQPPQFLYVETITIPPGQLYLLDATLMVAHLQFFGELWITSSAPIRFLNVFSSPDAGATGVSVSLPSQTLDPAPPIQLTLPASPTSVSWSWQVGTPAPRPATVTLYGSLGFTTSVSTTGGQWLSVSSVRNGPTTTLTLTPDPSKLGAGSYSGTVTVTPIAPPSLAGAPIVPTTINVSLTATSLPQISFTGQGCCAFVQIVMGQPAGPSETGTVTSNGNPVQVTVSASSGGNWLTVLPLSGVTPLQLTVTANTTGLNAPLSGQITIQGPGNTITVPVTVRNPLAPSLSAATTQAPALMISGSPPSITLPAGTPPPKSASGLLGFQEFDVALTSVSTNVSWLTADIESPGPAPPRAPAAIEFYANAVGLSPGVYSGIITIQSNYPTLQVPATLTVIQAPTSQTMLTATPPSLSFTATTGGLSQPQNLAIGFNTGPVQFNLPGRSAMASVATAPGSTTAQPVFTFLASAYGLPPGTYYGGLIIDWGTGSTTVPVTLSVTANTAFPPIIASIVNGASQAPRSIAPGEIVTILGLGVGPPPSGLQFDATGKVATTLGTGLGTAQVLIGGTAAPLIYASTSQVNAIVPYAIGNSGTTTIQVVYGGVTSATWELPLAASASSIFTVTSTGEGQAAVLNQDNTVNGPSNPAARGSVIQIYATGGGQTGGITGALALPGEKIILPVVVKIGGVNATVSFAGSAPGEVEGLVQINAVVPANVAPGASIPIEVDIGATVSQAGVTVAVK